MIRTDDARRDFTRWDMEQWEKEQKFPICAQCGQRIYDEYAYRINRERYCGRCIDDSKEYLEIEEDDAYGD